MLIFCLSRNPLKSGQCFLQLQKKQGGNKDEDGRNPLKSGQCFLRGLNSYRIAVHEAQVVAIPSNRVNVSYCVCNGAWTK